MHLAIAGVEDFGSIVEFHMDLYAWGPPRVKVMGGATKEVGLSVRLECY